MGKPFWAIIAASIIAGTSGIFIKYVQLPPTSFAFFRVSIPLLVVMVIMISWRIPFFRGNYKYMLGISLINSARMFFFFLTYLLTSVGNAVVALYTWPIFATMFSVWFLGESISRRQVLLILLASLGVVVVSLNKEFSFSTSDLLGIGSALATASLYAGTVVMFKKEMDNYQWPELIFYQNIVSFVVFLPFILFTRPFPNIEQISLASVQAVLIGLGVFGLFFYGLRHLKASQASLLSYLEIVSAIILAFLILDEDITPNLMVGGGMIIASTLFLK
ncbi:MAG: DMT family transporter, partial [Bacteroidota bacterium]